MNTMMRVQAFLLLAICLVFTASAQLAVPSLTARVTDTTSTLSPEQTRALEQSLQEFEAKKGAQIGVLIVSSTAPETMEQYAMRVVEQWKLGRQSVDDGALLVIAKDDRAVRIEVGYGLEGELTDAVSKRIIEDVILPKLKQGDFYGGVSDGIVRMMAVINGESLPTPVDENGGADIGTYVPLVVVVAFAVGRVLRSLLGRVTGAVASGGVVALFVWIVAGTLYIAVAAGLLAFVLTFLGIRVRGFGAADGSGLGAGRGFGGRGGRFGGGGASGNW